MTKVTILGADTQEKKELKKIEFKYSIDAYLNKYEATTKPNEYNNITLISKSYTEDGLDIMYAYDSNINNGCIYLGHFNDGVV